MTEVKFRAWCPTDKKMYAWHEIGLESYGPYVLNPEKSDIREFDADLIFMQYVGLKDKNDTEIYSGDILRGKPHANSFVNRNGVVVFDRGRFVLKMQGVDRTLYEMVNKCEVVGNIYENPELADKVYPIEKK